MTTPKSLLMSAPTPAQDGEYEVASASVPACPWQDISTAPKDKIIDLWTEPYGRVADAQWDAQRSRWVDWGMTDFDGVGYRRVEGRVTHRMPPPPPPVGSGQNLADATQNKAPSHV